MVVFVFWGRIEFTAGLVLMNGGYFKIFFTAVTLSCSSSVLLIVELILHEVKVCYLPR